jgi:hypothetical protein
MGMPVSNCVALLLVPYPGGTSLARPGFALYVTKGGGDPMSVRTLLASEDMGLG